MTEPLTPREFEILGLLAMGFMNPEIAEQLIVSVRTVEAHRSAILRKTGCRTRAELTAFALDHGVVRR
jgi:two-component system, NarL family, response regulator NreC